jgi:hypothetical protein
MGFEMAVDLAPLGSLLGGICGERRLQALLDETWFEADHGARAALQGGGDLAARQVLLIGLISLEEHAGRHQLMGRRFALTNQMLQFLLLFCTQLHWIAFCVHDRSPPELLASSIAVGSASVKSNLTEQ